jgi:hypothetical protein
MIGLETNNIFGKRFFRRAGVCSVAGTLLLLTVAAAVGLDGRPREPRVPGQATQVPDAQAQGGEAQDQSGRPPADTQAADSAASQPRLGPLDTVGRWIGDTVSSAGAGIGAAWQGTVGGFSGIGSQAGSAAKGAADAASTVAKGAADVAKGTADAVTRFPASRIASGRERCIVAPNGAPDCRVAAETLCKSKGFNSGTSVDFENVENCPAQVLLSGRRPAEGQCPVDYFVTRSLCQ